MVSNDFQSVLFSPTLKKPKWNNRSQNVWVNQHFVLKPSVTFLLFSRFSLNLGLYCLYLNMGNFGLSIFLTQLLFGAIEIPANVFSMWLLEVFGRRILFIATLVSAGVLSILILAVPQGTHSVVWFVKRRFNIFLPADCVKKKQNKTNLFPGYAIAVTSLAVAGRFFLIWAGSICSVFMQELFPTSVR